MTELACRKCKFISINSPICKNCGNADLTKEWYGYIIILDPEKSQIAKKLGVARGKYALKVG
jgi:DNA-directed RNA polymerase subunit E"